MIVKASSPRPRAKTGLRREVESLREELSQARQQQAATAEVLKTISRSSFDLPVVLDALVATAARLCGATFAGIFLREGDRMRGGATIGLEASDVAEFMHLSLPVDNTTVSGRVILASQIVNIADVEADAGYDLASIRKVSGIRSMMGVPLLRNGRAEGVFFLGRNEADAFSDGQCELVQTFADQAVIAIETARLFEEVQARTRELQVSLEYQTATSDLLSVISRSPTQLQPVLDAIVETAARLCGADKAVIRQRQGDNYEAVAAHGFTPQQREFQRLNPVPAGAGSVVGRVALSHSTSHIPDIHADPDFTQFDLAKAAGFQSLLSVPLLREGELMGVLVLAHDEARPFTGEQIERAESFADQAVIAIENARLFEEVQQRNRELEATSEVLRVISSSPTDVQPVFEAIAESAARLCNSEYAYVQRFDGTHVHLMAHHGLTPEEDEATRRPFPMVPIRGYMGGRAILSGKVEHIADYEQDPEYVHKDVTRMMHLRSAVAVPMLRDGAAIGAILLDRTQSGYYSERQVQLLQTFADQAVIAIENARLFEEVQQRNRELTEALEQQTATGAILRVIAASPTDVQPVLDTLVESAARLCEAHDSIIILKEAGILSLKAHYGPMAVAPDSWPIGRNSVSGRAIWDRAPVHVHDLFEAADEFPVSHELAVRLGHRANGVRAADARGRGYRHRWPAPPRSAAVQPEADQSPRHLRRPGGDRHRERTVVRGSAGAQPRSDRGAGAADRNGRDPQRHRGLAHRCAACP